MIIKDNSKYNKEDFTKVYPNISNAILDKSLSLLTDSENILIFPNSFEEIDDLDKESKALESLDNNIRTQNTVGFLGYDKEELEIKSRFSSNSNSHFLNYMLYRVLNINIIDVDMSMSFDNKIYELLIYLFPKYLNNALKKGMYREYTRNHFNDMNVKGNINISKHIKNNIPFNGKISYSTKELTSDNSLIQLIRHTIEHIKASSNNSKILTITELTKNNIRFVLEATPNYKLTDRRKVILTNSKPVRHAYYREYRNLQQLCLYILKFKKHDMGNGSQNIYGILFDVAWLWEEYINILIGDEFLHPINRKSKGGISLFSNRQRTVYPDFYNINKKIVLDAKYKKLETSKKGISREDLYQLISYSYILETKNSGVIYPSKNANTYSEIGILQGYGAKLFKYSLEIPQEDLAYRDFVNKIKLSEDCLKKYIFEKIV